MAWDHPHCRHLTIGSHVIVWSKAGDNGQPRWNSHTQRSMMRRMDARPPTTRADARWLLALAWIAGFTLIDSSIVSLALADIARDFDRSVGELAWVSTGYLLALAATLLAAGRLADRFGFRPILLIGAIGFGLLTAACGLAPSFEFLIGARITQGISGGILYTVSLAITVTAFPPERRPWAIGIYFTSGALGAVIGPVIGGVLTDIGGWRLVFMAQLPLPVVVAIGAIILLPARGGRPGSVDPGGIATASLFIVAATFALLELAEPDARPIAIAAAVVAAFALLAFVVIERRVRDPAVRLELFGNPRFVVATVAGAGAWFAIMSSTIYPALYLQLGRGISATESGLMLLAAPLVGLAFFPFAGRLVARVGVERALLGGLLLLVAAAAAMVVTWNGETPLWFIVATNLVTGAGISVTLVASASDAMAQFTPAEVGTGSAVFNSLRQLGAAMGVAVPAVVFELIAGGSRTPDATLDGSTGAFAIRLVVLAIPLLLVLGRPLLERARAAPAPA
jgi:EmrB/QacA subfamily drug resistance transporter